MNPMALKINYPSKVVGAWLEQLNALGVVQRAKNHRGTNNWVLRKEYISLMETLQGVKATDETLREDDISDTDEPDIFWKREAEAENAVLSEDEIQEILKNSKDNPDDF